MIGACSRRTRSDGLAITLVSPVAIPIGLPRPHTLSLVTRHTEVDCQKTYWLGRWQCVVWPQQTTARTSQRNKCLKAELDKSPLARCISPYPSPTVGQRRNIRGCHHARWWPPLILCIQEGPPAAWKIWFRFELNAAPASGFIPTAYSQILVIILGRISDDCGRFSMLLCAWAGSANVSEE